MSLFKTLRGLFSSAPAPSKLRNKPGGMAWIRGLRGAGQDVLNGRAVKTVSYNPAIGTWRIDPPQLHMATSACCDVVGTQLSAGDWCRLVGVNDANLEPWRDAGDDEQDESKAWLPPVPRTVTPTPCAHKKRTTA